MARIVIIEDDGALRNDMADRIGDWGHEVFQASDSLQGYQLIEDCHPDLVLCDIFMPNENGFDLVKRVRADSFRYAHMAIIFISALAEAKALTYGSHCGADDYITKPVDYAVLREKIAQHLLKNTSLVARFAKLIASKPDVKQAGFVERRSKTSGPRPFGRRKMDA